MKSQPSMWREAGIYVMGIGMWGIGVACGAAFATWWLT